MTASRPVVTARLAAVAGVVGVASLAAALTWRASDRGGQAPDDATPQVAGAPADAAAGAQDAANPGVSTDPEIGTIYAAVAPSRRGIELAIKVAFTVPPRVELGDELGLEALCAIGGEWREGSGRIALDRLDPGGQVETRTLVVARQQPPLARPSMCVIGVELSGANRPLAERRWLARRCWNGTTVVDGSCPLDQLPGGVPAAVSEVRIGWQGHGLDVEPPYSAELDLDVEQREDSKSWGLRTEATCTLAGGAVHRDAHDRFLRRFTPDPAAGPVTTQRITVHERLFERDRLLALPAACTVSVELVDLHGLVREPLVQRCWRAGATAPGACAPGP